MAKSQEINLNQIYEMLNRLEESQKETKTEITEQITQMLTKKLDDTSSEIHTKIEDVKLDLSIKLNDTNFKLEQHVEKINSQLKSVVDTVNSIENRCTAMETKIDDRCKSLEITVKRAFTEQVNVMDAKMRQHFVKCEQEIASVRTDTERLDVAVMQNADTINKLEHAVSDNENKTSAHSDQFKDIDQRFERLKREFKSRGVPSVVYQGHWDDRDRITFKGNRFENPMEFLVLCEREMETVSSDMTDAEKIQWVARHLKDSARQWYNIVRDKITTYNDLKTMLESRYWNTHIQSQIRNELEYGQYQQRPGHTAEKYIIQKMEQYIHLKPPMTEEEIIGKLSQHFSKTIRVAAYTQGIKTLDELLLLVAQSVTYISEDTSHGNVVKYRREPERDQQEPQNKYWKQQQPDKSKGDYQKPPYYKKPFYMQKQDRSDYNKVVHSLTIDKSAKVATQPKAVKETGKKYYVDTTKNVIPSTSTGGAM